MPKLTDIIGSRVISVYNGKYEGYVTAAAADAGYKKITALRIADEETETIKRLLVRDIFSLNTGIILIRNTSKIIVEAGTESELPASLINKTVLDLDGKTLGLVKDVNLNENYSALSISTETEAVELDKVISFGENFLLINNTDKKISAGRFKPDGIKVNNAQEAKPDNRVVSIETKTP
ncbi:MAG: hypothetical protein FWE53_00840 [Firmicutes bacterium]|nr:hypothetical protein [Bacillota bacterium]